MPCKSATCAPRRRWVTGATQDGLGSSSGSDPGSAARRHAAERELRLVTRSDPRVITRPRAHNNSGSGQSPSSVQEPRYGNWVRAPAAAECGGRVSECRSAVRTRAGHEPSRSLKFTIAEEATARAFSWLKVPNNVKTLIYCPSLMIFLSAISCHLMYLWVNAHKWVKCESASRGLLSDCETSISAKVYLQL